MRFPSRNRKKWVCYPPNYAPGDGFKYAYSNYQMKKIMDKYGVGAECYAQYLVRDKTNKTISFWNTRRDDNGWVMV